ncbi:MAG: secretin N-terminal domain-containing protein [Campylobacterota bacterium]|nr:secretin N-terminal domain-containing protein [Campylobacterota bacterium]
MKLLILIFLTFSVLNATSKCKDTLFSFDITKSNSSVKIVDIVENLAHQCKFSVKIKDAQAKKVLNDNLYLVHIKDYTLEEMFDFLFVHNNMFYEYDDQRALLNVSYLETRSFVIDYINLSEHTTDSIKTITVGASSNQNDTGMNGGGSSSTSSGGSSGVGSSSGNSENSNGASNSDATTIISKSKFMFWDNLAQEIDVLLSRDGDAIKINSKSIINPETGIVTITGTRSQINRIRKYIEHIKERLHKQVLLETKLFEVTYADIQSTGINWSKLDVQLSGSAGQSWTNLGNSSGYSFAYDFSMDGLFNFLNKYGNVNVLSTPKILTLNNQPAVINVGKQINYRYQNGALSTAGVGPSLSNTYVIDSVFIGLTLNIIPEITSDGFVILRINPVVSERDEFDLTSSETSDVIDEDGVRIMPPDIKIKQLSSIVKVKDGSKVIVGGLISSSNQKLSTDVPVLSSIPLVGLMFQSDDIITIKRELVVVVTPKIIDHTKFPSLENVEELLDMSESEKEIKVNTNE